MFFIALTLFAVLGPAIILMLSILGSNQVPGFVAFVQPHLPRIALSLYSTAVNLSNDLTGCGAEGADSGAGYGDGYGDATADAHSSGDVRPGPLDLPRRSGNDPL